MMVGWGENEGEMVLVLDFGFARENHWMAGRIGNFVGLVFGTFTITHS
jgi:hypothetical protein